MDESSYEKAIGLLETCIREHIATLKYLAIHREHALVNILEDDTGWAVLSLFPTAVLSYDKVTYPHARRAVFVNGTSDTLQRRLFSSLPANNYVLRLNQPLDLTPLEQKYNISRGFTYLSYSANELPAVSPPTLFPAQSKLTEEAIKLFIRNDYSIEDLGKYFKNGARWFGFSEDNKIKSLCLIYQDYGVFREIGGVRTLETERRKGCARAVVYSALKYLLDNNYLPRYVTEVNNTGSIRLAESLGMKPFLKIEHFLLESK